MSSNISLFVVVCFTNPLSRGSNLRRKRRGRPFQGNFWRLCLREIFKRQVPCLIQPQYRPRVGPIGIMGCRKHCEKRLARSKKLNALVHTLMRAYNHGNVVHLQKLVHCFCTEYISLTPGVACPSCEGVVFFLRVYAFFHCFLSGKKGGKSKQLANKYCKT